MCADLVHRTCARRTVANTHYDGHMTLNALLVLKKQRVMRACALTDVRKNDLGDFVIVSQKMVVCAMFCVGCLGDLIPVLSAPAPPLPSSVSLLRLPSVNEREIKLIPDKKHLWILGRSKTKYIYLENCF